MKQPAIYALILHRLCPWWQNRTNYYKIWHRSPLIFLLVRYMYIKLDSLSFCLIFWMFEMLISIKINLNLCFLSMPFEVILSKICKYFLRSLFEKIIKLKKILLGYSICACKKAYNKWFIHALNAVNPYYQYLTLHATSCF